jgi:outer membrane protein assembly factor BamB
MSLRHLYPVVIAAAGLLAACGNDTTAEPPAELVDINSTLAVHRLWSEGLGGSDGETLRLTLGVQGFGDTVYAAGRGGDVRAMDAATGKLRWSTDTDLELSAGPGVGEGLVVVGTSDGDLVALEIATGKQRWKTRISGEILAPPLPVGDHVVLRSVEGRLRSLAATDGKEQWLVEDVVPRLSLRGTGTPVAADGNVVVAGFDTGKVMAVSLDKGETLWQLQLATPSGRTELDRLSDVDSAVQISGKDVYAVGYQGRVAMLSLDNGQMWWSRDLSSYRGLALDDDQVYVATSEGSVVALRRRDGAVVWEQKALARRGLSAPAVVGSAVAVGDFEGYLHFLDRSSGKFVAREHPGSERIAAPPLVIGDRIYVIDEGGELVAYRVGSATGG